MTTRPTARFALIPTLLASMMLPAAAGAATFCTREITGVRTSDAARLQIRAIDAATGTNEVLMTICNLESTLGTFTPGECNAVYAQLLAAFHTATEISIQLRDSTMDASGLWGEGRCTDLLHHGDYSSAIATIESRS